MLFGDRTKGRGWGKRGDSKQALRAAVVETLEQRRMLAATPLAVENARGLIYDSTRDLEYIPTEDGKLLRYDATTGSFLTPIQLPAGTYYSGGDITPDGRWVYLMEWTKAAVVKVDLTTGTSTTSSLQWQASPGFRDFFYTTANGQLIAYDAQRPGLYGVNAQTGDLAYDGDAPGGYSLVATSRDRGSWAWQRTMWSASVGTNDLMGVGEPKTILLGDDCWPPHGVAVGNGRAQTAVAAGSSIVMLNSDLVQIWRVSGVDAEGLCFDADGDTLFALDGSGVLSGYDVSTGNVTWCRSVTPPIGAYPDMAMVKIAIPDDEKHAVVKVWGKVYAVDFELAAKLPANFPTMTGGSQATLSCDADWGPGQVLTYEWDYDYDGTTFGVDATRPNPAYTAPLVSSPTTQVIGLRIRASDGQVSDIVTTTVAIRPWQPTLSAGAPYTVGEESSISLHGSVSNADGAAVSAYEWDFSYDGQTFDIDRAGQAPVFSAAGIDGPATRTIALRVRADNGAVSDVVSTTVSITNVAPTASFAAENTVLGGDGTVIFTGATDVSVADRAAGFHYSFDFDNDGIFEIEGSSLASVTVPSTYIPNAGSYPMRGRVTDQNGGSHDYTASLVVRALPVALAGGPYSVVDGGTVGLNGTAQSLQSPSQAAYEWDLNYDGQSFDVDATGQTPMFSAAALTRGNSRTIALRVRDGDGTVSSVAISTVSVTNAPPTATFASGGNVTLGAGGTVAFSNVRDSAADLAGMRYNYDLNNDGKFEVRNSTSPACEVAASYLATPGKHTVRARIKDSGGLYTDYTADIPVNVAADYYPMVPGLKWNYAGTADGRGYTWAFTSFADQLGRQAVLRQHYVQRASSSGTVTTFDDYLANNAGLVSMIRETCAASGYTSTLSIAPGMPWYPTTQGVGWSGSWQNLTDALSIHDSSRHVDLTGQGPATGTLTVVKIAPLTLSNGLRFTDALEVKSVFNLSFDEVYSNGVHAASRTEQTITTSLVRGLGVVKQQAQSTMHNSQPGGADKAVTNTYAYELSSVPAWAKYLSFAGDVLQVNGTEGADTINFESNGANLTCYRNGVPQSVPLASVHGVVINALGGNDVVDARALWVPVTITGGGGRDSLVGGHVGDVISGGGGADTLLGGGGADAIRAGSGNDSVLGQGGNDSVDGGLGNDTLDGGAGEDTLVDASGASVQRGGAGADYIDARNGWTGDVIDGGSEADTVLTDVREGALNAEYCYAKTPKVPGGLTAAAGVGEAGGVTASWSSAKWAQSYRIERSLDGSAFELLATVPGSVLSYADSSVLSGVTYYYRICAINPIGVSAYGAGTSVTAG